MNKNNAPTTNATDAKSSATPGPWVIRQDGAIAALSDHNAGFSDYVCRMPFGSTEEANECPTWIANARLIAAAPALLEALENVLARLDLEMFEQKEKGVKKPHFICAAMIPDIRAALNAAKRAR